MNFYRNSAAIVANRDAIIQMNHHVYFCAVPTHSLIDRIVDDLINQMMQTINRRRADIHSWSFTNGFKPLKDLNIIGGIGGVFVSGFGVHSFSHYKSPRHRYAPKLFWSIV